MRIQMEDRIPPARARNLHRSIALGQRGPQASAVKPEAIQFSLFPAPTGDNRSPLIVDLQHQLGGLASGVSEQILKDPRHVRHQIDGIVPDDHQPGGIGSRFVLWNLGFGALGSGDRFHESMLPRRSGGN